MKADPDLRDIMLRWYTAMSRGDIAAVAALMSTQAGTLVVGTAPEEWWFGRETFVRVLKKQMEEVGGSLNVTPGDPIAHSDGDVGWVADRPLVSLPNGISIPMRITGVLRREDEAWKIVQWHASVAAGNEETFGQELSAE